MEATLLFRYLEPDLPEVEIHRLLESATFEQHSVIGVVPVLQHHRAPVVSLHQEAGVGVPHPDSWERDEPPAPEALAEAVGEVLAARPAYAAAARERAVERFSLDPWLDRHEELFSELTLRPRSRPS